VSGTTAVEVPASTQTLAELLDDGLFLDGDWVETKDQDPNGEVRLIQLADVGDGVFRDRSSRFLTMAKAKELRCTFLQPDDILVARMPEPLGRACIFPGVGRPAITAVDVCILRPNPERARSEWLVGAINSPDFRASMEEFVRGTTRQRISRTNLGTLTLTVPSLEAQLELSSLIGRIELKRGSADNHVAAARLAVIRFRQTVLAAACSGRLTADWRLSMGREDASEQPAGWSEGTVASLAADVPRAIQSGPFGSNLKHSEFQTKGRLVIGIDNVLDGRFVLGSQHRISEAKFDELKKYEARPLDVLITVMATVGRVCVVPDDIEASIITKHVYRITVNQERVLPFFLMHALRGHPRVREQIHSQTRGQTRPGINGQIVKGLVIALPPIDEQREIVRRVDQLLALAESLRERIELASERVERSSQAVLAKAFRGDLTPSAAMALGPD
jgi:type I restriction enzyme S subunit